MEKNELRKITREELDMILKNHKLWIGTHGKEGERADLPDTDLHGATLTHANLKHANLYHANLRLANLRDTNLKGADLSSAKLRCADLTGANLSDADLKYANLQHANLEGGNLLGADLEGACLAGADLEGANLRGANLYCADLRDADLFFAYLHRANLTGATLTDVKNFPNIPMVCPTEGSFIGWKYAGDYIVKLEIPEDAKRSSGTSKKCRCSKAKVLAIEHVDGIPIYVTEVCSDYDPNFIYRVGETVTVDNFDDNRFNECAPGIHFYMYGDRATRY